MPDFDKADRLRQRIFVNTAEIGGRCIWFATNSRGATEIRRLPVLVHGVISGKVWTRLHAFVPPSHLVALTVARGWPDSTSVSGGDVEVDYLRERVQLSVLQTVDLAPTRSCGASDKHRTGFRYCLHSAHVPTGAGHSD